MAIRPTLAWVDSLRPAVPTLTVADLAAGAGEGAVIVDIRELQERIDQGAIPGSHHVPRGMLEFWADPAMDYYRPFFREDKEIIVYCAGGARSVLAALALLKMGYEKVSHLEGGFSAWKDAGMVIDDVAATARWQRKS